VNGEPHHLTVYSDLHADARAANPELIKAHMDKRAALPRSHFFLLGDAGDYIIPQDKKRHRASVTREELLGVDDYIDMAVELQVEELKAYNWIAAGMGNHCDAVLKHHGTNPMRRLCRKLMIPFAGFTGFLRIRFLGRSDGMSGSVFNLLYHHGAWGGRVIKGYGGARDYARHFEGWDVFCYGHNHQLNVHHEAMMNMNSQGNLMKRSVFYVNTGTFLETYNDGGESTYGEIRGYPPVALSAPLITITPLRNHELSVSVTAGEM